MQEGVYKGSPDELKWASLEVKDVDDDGLFEGYLSRFGEEDLEGDIVHEGFFAGDLEERGPKRPLLWQHFPSEPIGHLKGETDDVGLRILGDLNLDSQRGRETHSFLKRGDVTGLSQGFETLESESRDGGDGRHLLKGRLWEGSVVTFPALPSAQVDEVRGGPPGWVREEDVEAAVKQVLQEEGILDQDEEKHEEPQEEELEEVLDRLESLGQVTRRTLKTLPDGRFSHDD